MAMNLGELLVKDNLITTEQLNFALDAQETTGKKLEQILLDAGIVDEKTIKQYQARLNKVDFLDLTKFSINKELSQKLPENFARRFKAIYLADQNNLAIVGMLNPSDIFALDEFTRILNKPIKTVMISENDLLSAYNIIYRRTGEISEIAGKLAMEMHGQNGETPDEEAIKQAEPAVLKLLNSVFEDADQVGASDIHIEPSEKILRIRLRVDGQLQEQTLPLTERHIALALSQRLKLMAGLDIAERRLPQDGRFGIKVHDTKYDVRLSTMPIEHGESIVMRLLNQSGNILDLTVTGMPKNILARFRQLLKIPNGMILVTGPTGSGKTTTLYGALNEVNEVTKNIITIEDPVEYRLERLNQVQVNEKIGLTFARILRATLRQDPNILLVGEIRDQETASIAMRAALTGHLVFATLHTNDAASSAIRLIDIGVEGYLVASTTRAIIAQRLARTICSSCSRPYTPTLEEKAYFTNFFPDDFEHQNFNYGTGCNHCNNTGFKGRIGVFELLELDLAMRDALRKEDTTEFTRVVAKNRTSADLLKSAYELAKTGIITLSEVLRVAGG